MLWRPRPQALPSSTSAAAAARAAAPSAFRARAAPVRRGRLLGVQAAESFEKDGVGVGTPNRPQETEKSRFGWRVVDVYLMLAGV